MRGKFVLSFSLKKIVRIANGSPMTAIIATRIPMSHVIGVFKPSTLVSTYVFIRSSEAVISLLTSSLTIKRILSRSASESAPIAGMAIAQKSIEKSKIVFMECSSSSFISPPAMVEGWQKRKKDSAHCSATQTGFKSISERRTFCKLLF